MTATNMCSNFGGKCSSPPLIKSLDIIFSSSGSTANILVTHIFLSHGHVIGG